MVNVKRAAEIISELSLLRFFPSDPSARIGLVRIACEMAANEDQIRWLVRRMTVLHNEWPGPLEMRAVFCSKFKPMDGINAYSQVYSDGIPSETEAAMRQISAPPAKRITAAEATKDAEMRGKIAELATMKRLP